MPASASTLRATRPSRTWARASTHARAHSSDRDEGASQAPAPLVPPEARVHIRRWTTGGETGRNPGFTPRAAKCCQTGGSTVATNPASAVVTLMKQVAHDDARGVGPASSANRVTRKRPSTSGRPRSPRRTSPQRPRASSSDVPGRAKTTGQLTGEPVPQRRSRETATTPCFLPATASTVAAVSRRVSARDDEPVRPKAARRSHHVRPADCTVPQRDARHEPMRDVDLVGIRRDRSARRPARRASAAIIDVVTPAPEPTTRTLARAEMHPSSSEAIARDRAPTQTCSSSDTSARACFDRWGPSACERRPDCRHPHRAPRPRHHTTMASRLRLDCRTCAGSRRRPEQRLFAREHEDATMEDLTVPDHEHAVGPSIEIVGLIVFEQKSSSRPRPVNSRSASRATDSMSTVSGASPSARIAFACSRAAALDPLDEGRPPGLEIEGCEADNVGDAVDESDERLAMGILLRCGSGRRAGRSSGDSRAAQHRGGRLWTSFRPAVGAGAGAHETSPHPATRRALAVGVRSSGKWLTALCSGRRWPGDAGRRQRHGPIIGGGGLPSSSGGGGAEAPSRIIGLIGCVPRETNPPPPAGSPGATPAPSRVGARSRR